MKLEKHDTELAKRLQILDNLADQQLANELMKLHESKCRACQEDRLSCTVRPACSNRNFLNTLIELGVEPQDLPEFCYSVYLDQLRRYILEGKGRGMNDRRLPIKDLLATLKVSSIRHFNSKFKKEWKNYISLNRHNQMLVAGDRILFHFDFTRGIVIVNPQNENLEKFSIFQLYTEVLSEFIGIKSEASTITNNWWELHVIVKGVPEADKLNKIEKELPESIACFAAKQNKESVEITIEFILDRRNLAPTVKELQDAIKTLGKLSN